MVFNIDLTSKFNIKLPKSIDELNEFNDLVTKLRERLNEVSFPTFGNDYYPFDVDVNDNLLIGVNSDGDLTLKIGNADITRSGINSLNSNKSIEFDEPIEFTEDEVLINDFIKKILDLNW